MVLPDRSNETYRILIEQPDISTNILLLNMVLGFISIIKLSETVPEQTKHGFVISGHYVRQALSFRVICYVMFSWS